MFATLTLTVALAAPVPKDGREYRDATPPKGWDLAELAAALPRPADAGRARVLAWEEIDTKRGFVIARALVVKALKEPTDAGERFVLAYLYRHPKEANPKWRRAEISGTRYRPNGVPEIHFIEGFTLTVKRPTEADISALLQRMAWADALTGDPDHPPKLAAGGVVYANWKAAFGRGPPKGLFPELKAK